MNRVNHNIYKSHINISLFFISHYMCVFSWTTWTISSHHITLTIRWVLVFVIFFLYSLYPDLHKSVFGCLLWMFFWNKSLYFSIIFHQLYLRFYSRIGIQVLFCFNLYPEKKKKHVPRLFPLFTIIFLYTINISQTMKRKCK